MNYTFWNLLLLEVYQLTSNYKTLSSKFTSFYSHMHFMSHNWSATKQRLHPQSVAGISRHSVLSGDRIRQCETLSVLLKETDKTWIDSVNLFFRLLIFHEHLQCGWIIIILSVCNGLFRVFETVYYCINFPAITVNQHLCLTIAAWILKSTVYFDDFESKYLLRINQRTVDRIFCDGA